MEFWPLLFTSQLLIALLDVISGLTLAWETATKKLKLQRNVILMPPFVQVDIEPGPKMLYPENITKYAAKKESTSSALHKEASRTKK